MKYEVEIERTTCLTYEVEAEHVEAAEAKALALAEAEYGERADYTVTAVEELK